MKQIIKATFLFLTFLFVQSCEKKIKTESLITNKNKVADSRIENLIKKMSVEQKVGQMTQINIDVVSKGEVYNLDTPHQIDSVKLDVAINKYFIGSILNAAGYPFSRSHWKNIITTIQKKAIYKSDL